MKRTLMFSSIGLFLSVGLGHAADQGTAVPTSEPKVVVKPVLSSSVTSAGDPIVFPQTNGQVIVSTYDISPGASLPVHKHPFPRYGYVLAGTLQVTNVETGKTDVFKTGDFILEAVGHWHRGSNMSTEPVKLLVIDLVEKGEGNTMLKV